MNKFNLKVLVTQSCPTLCDPMNCSSPDSSVHGILSYTDAYIWNLKRWYWWTYLQGNNSEADMENRLMDTGSGVRGEGEGEMYGESNMELTMPYLK